jgi:hypothetical protein
MVMPVELPRSSFHAPWIHSKHDDDAQGQTVDWQGDGGTGVGGQASRRHAGSGESWGWQSQGMGQALWVGDLQNATVYE